MKQLRKGKSGSTVIMTSGIPAAQILRFSVPLVFGNLFQQMYSIIDAAVIGNYVGVEAFAAVGCTGWVCWLINCFFRDSANAFSIPAAICIGKKTARFPQNRCKCSVVRRCIVLCGDNPTGTDAPYNPPLAECPGEYIPVCWTVSAGLYLGHSAGDDIQFGNGSAAR